MTPSEKAQELVNKYLNAPFNCKGCDMVYCDSVCTMLSLYEAKQCAMIAVDEMLTYARKDIYRGKSKLSEREYLLEVKKELSK
jgi:hypothetical protein